MPIELFQCRFCGHIHKGPSAKANATACEDQGPAVFRYPIGMRFTGFHDEEEVVVEQVTRYTQNGRDPVGHHIPHYRLATIEEGATMVEDSRRVPIKGTANEGHITYLLSRRPARRRLAT